MNEIMPSIESELTDPRSPSCSRCGNRVRELNIASQGLCRTCINSTAAKINEKVCLTVIVVLVILVLLIAVIQSG